MWKYGRLALVVAVGLFLLPLFALSDLSEDKQAHRAELEKLKATDEQKYEGLYQRAKEFLELPNEEQDRLREIDHEFQRLPLHVRQRLLDVGQKYAAWVARLPEDRQKKLRNAPGDEKLKLVTQYRQEEWIATLPKAHRELLAQRKGEARAKLIRKFRRDELKMHIAWTIAKRQWPDLRLPTKQTKPRSRYPMPTKLEHFPTRIQTFVIEYLLPRLSEDERELLEAAEKETWPWYCVVLVALADCHPLALPGPIDAIVPTKTKGFTTVAELPEALKKVVLPNQRLPRIFQDSTFAKVIKAAEGDHPGLGSAVARVLDKKSKLSKRSLRELVQGQLKNEIMSEARTLKSLPNLKEDSRAWRENLRVLREVQKKRIIMELWPTEARHLTKVMQTFLREKLEPVLTNNEAAKLKKAEGAWPDYPVTIQTLAEMHYLGREVPWQSLRDFRYPFSNDFWAGLRVDRNLLKGW
ncbi:MAG: hypothetical protein ACFCD0_20895 [Gemmataceae bacterium]